MNIQGENIPEIDKELDELLKKGIESEQKILPGASDQIYGDKKPYARTSVKIDFENEDDLRRCVRLLRWSDERLATIGPGIAWTWDLTTREGMTIKFAVNWYEKDFFEQRKDSFKDDNHISYFKMFGKDTSDMDVKTEILE